MYDIEMREANKLIDDTKRDAAAAHMKTQKAEQEVAKQKARYNDVSNGRDAYRKEIDAIERQIAENEAVRFPSSDFFFFLLEIEIEMKNNLTIKDFSE